MPTTDKRVRIDQNRPTWIDLNEWKALAGDEGDNSDRYCLHKTVSSAVVKQDGDVSDDRTIKFVVSNASPDRDKDIVDQKGWNLDNYTNNPVVLFGHDYHSLPVAKSISIVTEGGQLISTAKFATAEENPFADSVYRMLKGGYLNAVSAGFIPTAYKEDKDRGGYNFLKQELLEYSVVPVPANAEALVQARSAGIPMEPIKKWAEGILEKWDESVDEGGKYKAILEGFCKDCEAVTDPEPDTSSDETHLDVIKQTAKDMADIMVEHVQETEDKAVEPEPEPEPEATEAEAKEVITQSLCAELAHRGFEVKVDDALLGEDMKMAHAGAGVECKDWSDDQIFDYLARHKSEDTAIEVTDDFFGYDLTEIEDETERKTYEDVTFKSETEPETVTKDAVQKVNPVVVNSTLPQSYEAVRQQLKSSAKNFLTGHGHECRDREDYVVMIGTFQKEALFCVLGYDRSWDDDPTYQGSWKMNRRLGMAEWSGEPAKVEVQVSMDVIEASASAQEMSNVSKIKGTGPVPQTVKEEDESDVVKFEDGSTASMDDVIEVLKSHQKESVFTINEETLKDTLVGAVRQAQGKLD